MPRPDRDIIAELIAVYEPTIRQSFLDAVQKVKSSIILKVVVERLERRDLEGAIAAMNLEIDAFALFERAIIETYVGGGTRFVENLPKVRGPDGNRVQFFFGVRNEPGEAELRAHSAELVTNTVAEQRQNIARVLEEGLSQGRNPTQTAIDVVGHVNRITGEREGGIIGLSEPQERTMKWVREGFRSNDVEAMKRYLGVTDKMLKLPRRELLSALKETGLKRRDRRFDSSVLDVIEGKAARIKAPEKALVALSNSYLKLRGDAIGLNETMNALGKSRNDAIRQQIAAGKMDAQDVVKIWHHHAQEHPRLQHIAMNGKSVGFDDRFQLPDGTMMKHPHDPDGGPKHNLFCRCYTEYKVDFFASVVRRQRAA